MKSSWPVRMGRILQRSGCVATRPREIVLESVT